MNNRKEPPYTINNPKGTAPIVLICDHASNYVPTELANLGLASKQLEQHIGWDIGAAEITLEMSRLLNAPAVLSGTSRLVIDANRAPKDPTGIPLTSDDIRIPGNQNLSDQNRRDRRENYFTPYHQAVTDVIERQKDRITPYTPAVFSVHTFTPATTSDPNRPWHAGVLWNKDPRIAVPLIEHLTNHPNEYVIGDNEPYSGKEVYYSVDSHVLEEGLPHCAIEVRQDLVQTKIGCVLWANIIANILTEILKDKKILQFKHF